MRTPIVATLAGAGLLLLAGCGTVATTTPGTGATAAPTSSSHSVTAQATGSPAVATAPPTAAPTAVPTAVPTPNYSSQILAYATYVEAEAPTMVTDLTAVSTDASNDDTVSLVTDEQTLINDATQFRTHIDGADGLVVPQPLQHINGLYTEALTDIIASGNDAIAGVNNDDVNDITTSTTLLQTATSLLGEGNTETQALASTITT